MVIMVAVGGLVAIPAVAFADAPTCSILHNVNPYTFITAQCKKDLEADPDFRYRTWLNCTNGSTVYTTWGSWAWATSSVTYGPASTARCTTGYHGISGDVDFA